MSNFSLTPDTAAQIARQDPTLSQNTEQGFANTYGPGTNTPDGQLGFAVPAVGMSALGLYLLYQKYQQDKLDKEKVAAVDLQALRAQMPGFHLPDTLLGAAGGAGAGLLYDYVRGGEKGKRFPTALRRALLGALVGAGATNLVGDRARRYLTNSVVPAGYDAGNILAQLKPRSWQHVWDAAGKDIPSFDPAVVQKFTEKFKNPEVGQRALTARREIERIAQGIDTHNPDSSMWQRNADKTYSLNEKNKEYLRNLAAIYLPSSLNPLSLHSTEELGVQPDQHPLGIDMSGLFKNPEGGLKFINSLPLEGQLHADLFGTHPLLGAQQLIARQNGKDVEGMSLDRHDVTPSASSARALHDAITSGKALDPKWRAAQATGTYENGQTNAEVMRGTIGRMIWDRVLRHENPWVAQKFKFTPTQGPTGESEYGMQMLRQDNTPAFQQPIGRGELSKYLEQVQNTAAIPEL